MVVESAFVRKCVGWGRCRHIDEREMCEHAICMFGLVPLHLSIIYHSKQALET